MRISSFILVLAALTACEAPAPPPAEPPQQPVKPTPPPPPVAVVDAGASVPATVLAEPADGTVTQGLPDDAALNPEDLREAALQAMLLRDPDRAIRALEQAPTPSAFQVAVLAALAIRRRVEGPPLQVKETPLPTLAASGVAATEPGPAFVGVQLLEVRSAPGKGKLLATLPTGTEVSLEKTQGANATISVQLATRVDFGPEGDDPTNVVTTKVTGQVPLDALVTARPDVKALATEAANQADTDDGHDRALILWHRAFLLGPTEALRAEMLKAAWRARRPSWVASTALEPVWAAPKSLRVAWACKGALAKAKWVALTGKPPADVCFTGVDLRAACSGDVPKALAKRRELLGTLSVSESPIAEVVVDGGRAHRLWTVSLPIRPTNECDLEVEEHKLDVFGAVVRRLPLPLGAPSMVVSFPVTGWHGTEHSVVGAQSEAKARDWLRSRSRSKWTYDAKGEPAPSLSVGDTTFRLERDVASASVGRLPLMNCDVCGGGEFR
ncbi:MAG: hypothetical protein ABTQ32_29985 [Myxococcaceae bacterium]